MLQVVFEGGPLDGLEEQVDHLPSIVAFDRTMTWPGDSYASVPNLADVSASTARYRRTGRTTTSRGGIRRHVYEYVPLEPV